MHICFPTSSSFLSLLWWWAEKEKEEEEAELVVVVPEVALTKVGHGYSPALLSPWRTRECCTLAGSPTGLFSYSISALYSFSISAHFSFCLSQWHAFIIASRSRFLIPHLPQSVGMIFFLDTNSHFFKCQPCTTATSRTVLTLFLQHCLSAPSTAVTPFPSLSP